MVTPRSARSRATGLLLDRAATVRLKGELVGFNVLLATALGDEALRERRTFSVSQHPANHVAGEDVEDDVEVVVGPLDGATELRNIPRPNLVGRFGQQLRLRVVRMARWFRRLGPRRAPPKSDTSCESSRGRFPRPEAWPTPGRAPCRRTAHSARPRGLPRAQSRRGLGAAEDAASVRASAWRLRYSVERATPRASQASVVCPICPASSSAATISRSRSCRIQGDPQ